MNTGGARQPLLFVPHGAGPCFFMDWKPVGTWDAMARFLKDIANTLPARPKAIVLVSAHWLAPDFAVTAQAQPELVFDYYGFPEHTYQLAYPAQGQPQLAQRILDDLHLEGLVAGADGQRGFDHGMFIPLKLMFPAADIPVVQLSLRQDLDASAHMQAGRALASLRDEGVLILGSGMSFHNMRAFGDSRFLPISEAFDEWLTLAVASPAAERNAMLEHWMEAPQALLCHPRRHEEHLLPLMVVAGAAGEGAGRKIYSERVMGTRLSAFQFD